MSSPSPEPPRQVRRNHGWVPIVCGLAAVGMVGAAFAAVPFYHAFCAATGFNGTVRRAQAAPTQVLDRTVTVRFDTNVRGLPWTFTPEQLTQTVKIGAPSLAYFRVTNNGSTPLTGRAAYNVVPEVVAPYFLKTHCFCFSDQTIAPHQTERFPVIYFIEPKIVKDSDASSFQDITLSYTFYPAPDAKQAKAQPG